MKKLSKGTVSSPLGFKTNALCCGIRKKKADMALIYSIVRAQAAGVFTKNKVKAAPVEIDINHLRYNAAQAIIANSGNANCCTGKKGLDDSVTIITALSKQLKLARRDILIASTGVIGKYLPLEKITKSIPKLVKGLNFNKAKAAAKAIMTTDTFSKQIAVELKIKNKPIRIGAMAKGAGMICPNMATMLCFITTDANINTAALKKALKAAVDVSFNSISIDGQMSTNDTVIIMANGLAGNAQIKQDSREFKMFSNALLFVCKELAKMIVRDGEGATKFIEILVESARTKAQAETAARAIADSLLVKTMIAGNNPNWGRIPAALGATGISMDKNKLEISLQKKVVFKNNKPAPVNSSTLIKLLKGKNISIRVKLNSGNAAYKFWSSDLTEEYVKVNMAYN